VPSPPVEVYLALRAHRRRARAPAQASRAVGPPVGKTRRVSGFRVPVAIPSREQSRSGRRVVVRRQRSAGIMTALDDEEAPSYWKTAEVVVLSKGTPCALA
jgi:hypothetical protein